ncbi:MULTISPECIES: GNAT family N-acetyltransferase [unclassified Gordonia (in: high G+C Gram-positive bacteria)]|uniref:GNAT family N-acetyltransferase n=1 Tax=unclassified Gordonia (in: high G+C Gram-positive bacteria) TaxID=2657482 RepID=UPI001FFFAC6B|nr:MULTISPECIES: GNAT family N-acetyltransferase [unclassified Gordonia (in: high G+C Gram-positive bacteria)]UQE75959.1 N-acetyltransferase family protein [Gordonia sp. PP30]
MSCEIRAATTSDLEQITEIYAHYVDQTTATWRHDAPDLAAWDDLLASTRSLGLPFLVLAGGDGHVCGFAYLAPFRGIEGWRHTVEDTIYLRPESAGGGRGSRLLQALLDAVDPVQVEQVVAMISAEVAGSVALHRKLGFTEIGRLRRTGVKFGQRLDCVIMQRSTLET